VRHLLLASFLGIAFTSLSFAGGTITWPCAPPPPGGNSAATPVPSTAWLDEFQKRIDASHQMAKVDLIFDGDSITAIWRVNGASIWNDRYAKLNAYNFAYPGDATQHLLWRLQNGQVDNLHPKLVVLMIGANNYANTPEQTAEAIKAIIGEYQKRCPEAAILLEAIFPAGEQPNTPERNKRKATNQIISQFADGKKVLYIDFGDKLVQPDGTISKDMLYDFTHPTAKGYQIWADAIQPTIDRFFPPVTAPAAPAQPPTP
jgi:lysophospholipase L1-like esterase